jgi:hypothetical protein
MPRFILTILIFLFCGWVNSAQAERNLIRPPGTTRYASMVQQLTALVDYDKVHAARMTLTSLGQSVKGRGLWMATVGHGPKSVFYLCRQHGHEPASTEGALAFLNILVKADADTPTAHLLENVTVYVVPMANPDGSEAFRRHNARDVDLNRDWLRRTQPETRALYSALQRLRPTLVTDQHELYPDDTRPDFTETAGQGSRASSEIIAACDDVQFVVQGAMQAEGFSAVSHLVTDTHPARLAHRYISIVAGLPTVLFETNRLPGRSLASRAAAQTQFMLTVFRDMAGEREQLVAEAELWRAAHPSMLASRHKAFQRPPGQPSTAAQEKGAD